MNRLPPAKRRYIILLFGTGICGLLLLYTNIKGIGIHEISKHLNPDSEVQQYFHKLQCDRLPHWFYTYLEKKGPDYCPTIAVMSTTARRLYKKPEMVLTSLRTISSDQTVPPDAAFLVIPEYSLVDREVYRIPNIVSTHYLLKSCRDYGPATKFLAPLFIFEKYPCARLISFDDDMIYDKNTIERYQEYDIHPSQHKFKNPPNSSILASWVDYPAKKSRELVHGKDRPVKAAAPLGVYSYMYQPKLFDLKHIIWPDHLRSAFYREDDMWFGCLAKSMNISIYVVPGLDQVPQDYCPLDECLHNAVNDTAARQHLRVKDSCSIGQYLQWEDTYFPEAVVTKNVRNQ